MFKVTKVWPHEYKSGKLLGFADIEMSLDGSSSRQMIWKGLKVFQGDNRIEVRLPSVKDDKGRTDEKGNPVYHPVILIPNNEDNPNPPGAELMEHIRASIENAYNSSPQKKQSTGSTDHVQKDELPF